jgi:hypothetical protein
MHKFHRPHELKRDINCLIRKNLPYFITNEVAVVVTQIVKKNPKCCPKKEKKCDSDNKKSTIFITNNKTYGDKDEPKDVNKDEPKEKPEECDLSDPTHHPYFCKACQNKEREAMKNIVKPQIKRAVPKKISFAPQLPPKLPNWYVNKPTLPAITEPVTVMCLYASNPSTIIASNLAGWEIIFNDTKTFNKSNGIFIVPETSTYTFKYEIVGTGTNISVKINNTLENTQTISDNKAHTFTKELVAGTTVSLHTDNQNNNFIGSNMYIFVQKN